MDKEKKFICNYSSKCKSDAEHCAHKFKHNDRGFCDKDICRYDKYENNIKCIEVKE